MIRMTHWFDNFYVTSLFDSFNGHGYGSLNFLNGVQVSDTRTYFEQVVPFIGIYKQTEGEPKR